MKWGRKKSQQDEERLGLRRDGPTHGLKDKDYAKSDFRVLAVLAVLKHSPSPCHNLHDILHCHQRDEWCFRTPRERNKFYVGQLRVEKM